MTTSNKILVFLLVATWILLVFVFIWGRKATQMVDIGDRAYQTLSDTLSNCQEATRLSQETTRLSQEFVGVLYRSIAADALGIEGENHENR